jgi:formamidopyrimidine-DNA glycosylase
MPELPDITVYVERLRPRVLDQPLERIRLVTPIFLRTVVPSWKDAQGRRVVDVQRLAKRIVLSLEGDMHLVIHLMKLGRLRWDDEGKSPGNKLLHGSFFFPSGALHVIEIGPKKRASLHVVGSTAELEQLRPLGIEPLECDLGEFAEAMQRENHTLKRTLTDQRIIAGIGNAYSDEILHAARLSPIAMSTKLSPEEVERLYVATRRELEKWTDSLRKEVGEGFPAKVTAFRKGMAVHGRFKEPCPVCATPVERIVYADRETNYCALCQTGGKRLADRAMSRLLGKDWPRTLEELEERKR